MNLNPTSSVARRLRLLKLIERIEFLKGESSNEEEKARWSRVKEDVLEAWVSDP